MQLSSLSTLNTFHYHQVVNKILSRTHERYSLNRSPLQRPTIVVVIVGKDVGDVVVLMVVKPMMLLMMMVMATTVVMVLMVVRMELMMW